MFLSPKPARLRYITYVRAHNGGVILSGRTHVLRVLRGGFCFSNDFNLISEFLVRAATKRLTNGPRTRATLSINAFRARINNNNDGFSPPDEIRNRYRKNRLRFSENERDRAKYKLNEHVSKHDEMSFTKQIVCFRQLEMNNFQPNVLYRLLYPSNSIVIENVTLKANK